MIQIVPLNESRSLVPVPDLKLASLEEQMRRKLYYHYLSQFVSREEINKLIKINSTGILNTFKVITEEENSYCEDDNDPEPIVDILNLESWKAERTQDGFIFSTSGILATRYVGVRELKDLDRDGEFKKVVNLFEPIESMTFIGQPGYSMGLYYSSTPKSNKRIHYSATSSSKKKAVHYLDDIASFLSIEFENTDLNKDDELEYTSFHIKIIVRM